MKTTVNKLFPALLVTGVLVIYLACISAGNDERGSGLYNAVITVDASTVVAEEYSGVGRGFLHGLNGDATQPDDGLLLPLKPTLFRAGGQSGNYVWWIGHNGHEKWEGMYQSVKAHILRTTQAPYSAPFDLLVCDLYGYSPNKRPCDNGDCSDWIMFINAMLDKFGEDGLINDFLRFDIWNEPDNAEFWNRTSEQYHQMWNTAVNLIRSRFPNAVIVGPSTAAFKHDDMQTCINRFKTDGTFPDIWSWHFSADPVADAADIRAMLTTAGYPGMKLDMNEYLDPSQLRSGMLAWYLARLQRSGIDWAIHAIWADCCDKGLLDGALALVDGRRVTKGEYWVYRASALLPEKVLQSAGDKGIDLIAARNDEARKISILLGSEKFSGTALVHISGMDKTFPNASNVCVTVKRIADGIISGPAVEYEKMLPVKNGSVKVVLPWNVKSDAWFCELRIMN
ncbi:MAG: hypothetical protein LBP72_05505 [Dysgonamonadaceae bacterium]|jgi:hypothetical protein|nr:hypothetical protein [Dysgonamonadaceae bacterium]